LERNIQDDELEYNDGLGDMLRQKDGLEFSWARTTIVTVVLLAIVFIGVTFGIKYAKNQLIHTETTQITTNPEPVNITKISPITNTANKKSLTESKTETQATKPIPTTQQPSQQKIKPIKTQSTKAIPSTSSKKEVPQKQKPKFPYKLIAGVFDQSSFAKLYASEIKDTHNIDTFIWSEQINGKAYYRVQIGAFETIKEAKDKLNRIEQLNIPAHIITRH